MAELTRREILRKTTAGCAACMAAAALDPLARAAGETPQGPPPLGKADFPITKNAQDAEAMFRQGFNCAQAVLTCCARDFGLPEETGKRMGSAFVGGMGMMGLTCGSVTGAFMTIGMKHAQLKAEDPAPAGRANRLLRKFAKRFKALHGSICCNELLGLDISTDAGVQKAAAEGLFTTRCPVYVRDCAALLEHLFAEEDKSGAKDNADE